ncbi:peptidyl-prolyl cis-trans isomerase [Paenibacillus oenotherae]|uniref:peptidylprolyl isomerase n=1 Tax=Paenibacillus oenotherae TaxID=1435645 RepID=A0ABS7DE30_9BACL|nr:peptidyl-prolyl cis-trans isomerase [Paenibacillus oenotherae]MBW7477428.1 peptidyl-prolyl cis-trans isomerase [Paenibacillus oenotherae]
MMKKDQVLRGVVLLQAVCMIVLAVVVVTQVMAASEPMAPPVDEKDEGTDQASVADGIAATVGSEQITSAALIGQLRRQYGDSVLRTLMVRAAIRLEAEAYSLSISTEELGEELTNAMSGYEDEEHFYEAMKQQLALTPEAIEEDIQYRLLLEKIAIRSIDVTDSEVEDYIESNPEEFQPRTQYRLSWIVARNKRDAEDILQMLDAGEDFALLARTYSLDELTAYSGGDLGMIDGDDPFLDEAILDAASQLEPGAWSVPIKIDEGQAIIYLAEKRVTEQLDERRLREAARKQLALSQAQPLQQVEEELLSKYGAKIVQ